MAGSRRSPAHPRVSGHNLPRPRMWVGPRVVMQARRGIRRALCLGL